MTKRDILVNLWQMLDKINKKQILVLAAAIIVTITGGLFIFFFWIKDDVKDISSSDTNSVNDLDEENGNQESSNVENYEWILEEEIIRAISASLDLPEIPESFPGLRDQAIFNETLAISYYGHGLVSLFERQKNGSWVLEQHITNIDGEGLSIRTRPTSDTYELPGEPFGSHSIAMNDKHLVITNEYLGVYIFVKQDGKWIFQQELSNKTLPESITSDNNRFRKPIFADSETLILPEFPLRIFKLNQNHWELEQEIFAPDLPGLLAEHYLLGSVVSARDNLLALADINNAIYIFERDDDWELQQVISEQSHPQLKLSTDDSGWFLDINENTLAIGNPLRSLIYIFQKSDGQWIFKQEISKDSLPPGADLDFVYEGSFGESLSVRDNSLIVPVEEVIYIFRYNGEQWVIEQIISGEDLSGHEDAGGYFSLPSTPPNDDSLYIRYGENIYLFKEQPRTEQADMDFQNQATEASSVVEENLSPAVQRAEKEFVEAFKMFADEWQAFLNDEDGLVKQLEAIQSNLLKLDVSEECALFGAGEGFMIEAEIEELVDELENRLETFDSSVETRLGPLFDEYLEATGYDENDPRLENMFERTGWADFYIDFLAVHYSLSDKVDFPYHQCRYL